jgi:hypothetical protein
VNTKQIIDRAGGYLLTLPGHTFDVLTISKPVSPEAAVNLAKVISKLSPLLGNLIEFNTVELLNDQAEFKALGNWVRQDPGFPDTIFTGGVVPVPGFEIKAWFPLATEITARFRDSQKHFINDNTFVVVLAWLPENLIFGKPKIFDVCVVSGLSVAKARDGHYHNPPDYLVLEPEDTKTRTRNLQQTNTSGHKWQGTAKDFAKAKKIVAGWRGDGRVYKPTAAYQVKLRKLTSRFAYRLDTNFAKMDRIAHKELENFKERVLTTVVNGMSVRNWIKLLSRGDDAQVKKELERHLGIQDENAEELLD